jgi:hypothetical protein
MRITARCVTSASTFFGSKPAATCTNFAGSVAATVRRAAIPLSDQTSQKSRRKSSLSLFRDPFGRPAGFPDCPGLKRVGCLLASCQKHRQQSHNEKRERVAETFDSMAIGLPQAMAGHRGDAHRCLVKFRKGFEVRLSEIVLYTCDDHRRIDLRRGKTFNGCDSATYVD